MEDERVVQLNQAALGGNINDFYNLITEDVKLLEHIDELPFVETPLHKVASATGTHIPFAKEILRLKPSFVRKLNPDGLSPIHVALLNGNTEVVRWLLKVDADLVRVKGREGRTPLHDAAKTEDHLDLLDEFLKVCPDSVEDVTNRDETALHVAVKNESLNAFQRLVKCLRKNRYKKTISWKRKILNWKDEEGNTVLHVAVATNQPEAVRLLLYSGVDINAKNLENRTAKDISEEGQDAEGGNSRSRIDIRKMLERAEVTKSACLSYYAFYLKERRLLWSGNWAKISDDRRNVLLVVATLLMTVTYQGLLSPPGGLWQDDYNPGSNLPNATIPDHRDFVGNFTQVADVAGTAIASRDFFFWVFLITNTSTFMLSYKIVLHIIPSEYFILRAALGFLSACYFTSLAIIFPAFSSSLYINSAFLVSLITVFI